MNIDEYLIYIYIYIYAYEYIRIYDVDQGENRTLHKDMNIAVVILLLPSQGGDPWLFF
jgi:hypothetical protein